MFNRGMNNETGITYKTPDSSYEKDGKAVMRTIEDVLKMNRYTPWSVKPGSSVNDALTLMVLEQVGALAVIGAGKMVGVIYEKDCIIEVILSGRSIKETPVSEIMTRDIISISPTQTIEECLDLMTEKQHQYLPVTSGSSFVGFISMSDLFRTIVDYQKDMLYRLDNYVLGIDFGK